MGIHETTVTELLNSFLNKEPLYIRKAVVEFILNSKNPDITKHFHFEDFSDFTDQGNYKYRISNKAPDLVFEGKDTLIFLEVKINDAELQESQLGKDVNNPNCYLGILNNDARQHKELYFLVPSNYKHMGKIPVEPKNIITWKDLDKFVKENQYDNKILKSIISLSSDSSEDERIASDIDMRFLLYDLDYLPRLARIHNRLKTILEKSECDSKYFKPKDKSKIRKYTHFISKSDNPYPNGIAEGKYIESDNAFALCVIPGFPYIYLDVGKELKKHENLQPKLNIGTYVYKVCELDTPIDEAVNLLNKLIS